MRGHCQKKVVVVVTHKFEATHECQILKIIDKIQINTVDANVDKHN